MLLCGGDDIEASIRFVNHALSTRGLLPDGNTRSLDFTSGADAVHVVNAVYTLLQQHQDVTSALSRADNDLAAAERLTERAKADLHVERQQRQAAQRQADEAHAKLRSAMSRETESAAHARRLRAALARTEAAEKQVRQQMEHRLREKEAQMARLKEHMVGRRGGGGVKASSMTVRTAPVALAARVSRAGDMPRGEDSAFQLCQQTIDQLSSLCQQLAEENDFLKTTLHTTLDDVGRMVRSSEETHGGLVVSRTQTVAQLAAQLQLRCENLRAMLHAPSYVHMDELAARDAQLSALQQQVSAGADQLREARALIDRLTRGPVPLGASEVAPRSSSPMFTDSMAELLSPVKPAAAEYTDPALRPVTNYDLRSRLPK